ncbi:MAG: Clp protease ClpP [Dokdonella sp.]
MSLAPMRQNARTVWDANPHLSLTHADFGEFEQSYALLYRDACRGLTGTLDRFGEHLDTQRALARARINLVRNPFGTADEPLVTERKGNRLVIWIYGPIGEAPDAARADLIVDALKEHRDVAGIVLRIASAGGNVDKANAIAQAVVNHPARSIAIVDRFAYSGASLIASACNRVLMRRDATWMAHESWIQASGNADELLSILSGLRGSDMRMAGFCASRRVITNRDFYHLMKSGRYLTATEAHAAGVVDDVIPPLPINWDPPTDPRNT